MFDLQTVDIMMKKILSKRITLKYNHSQETSFLATFVVLLTTRKLKTVDERKEGWKERRKEGKEKERQKEEGRQRKRGRNEEMKII